MIEFAVAWGYGKGTMSVTTMLGTHQRIVLMLHLGIYC